MARGHPDLPKKIEPLILSKKAIFYALKEIDENAAAKQRILAMESDFRKRIDGHLKSLPTNKAQFQKFNTSPFVLMFYSKQQQYSEVWEIEKAIVPAKVFSSMETSAGRMVETVTLPVYGWKTVSSKMHSIESVLDGLKHTNDGKFMTATLKSGPRCLNDEMAKDIGLDIVSHASAWAASHKTKSVEFIYGVLYGTKKQSNKKDWHILRNIGEALPKESTIISPCKDKWDIKYSNADLKVSASVKVGIEWWDYLGGANTWIEICAALIRACIIPVSEQTNDHQFLINDLSEIVNLAPIEDDYNVAILQKSQHEWLLFLARHFCDEFTD